jgi:hypothetical protein
VTVSIASGSGVLSGTLSATTDDTGVATFSNVKSDTVELMTLTLSASGLAGPSADLTVNMTDYPGGCTVDDAIWTSADGGCKHVASGKVFSKFSANAMSWHSAVWDSTTPAGNSATDGNDSGRTNDYDPALTLSGQKDNSYVNYCHDLTEGGKADWRVPTQSEAQIIGAQGGTNRIGNPVGATSIWSSTSNGAADSSARYVNLSTGSNQAADKSNSFYVLCVRP